MHKSKSSQKLKDAEANIEIKAVYGFGYKLIVE